jgi:hypothetical protein
VVGWVDAFFHFSPGRTHSFGDGEQQSGWVGGLMLSFITAGRWDCAAVAPQGSELYGLSMGGCLGCDAVAHIQNRQHCRSIGTKHQEGLGGRQLNWISLLAFMCVTAGGRDRHSQQGPAGTWGLLSTASWAPLGHV